MIGAISPLAGQPAGGDTLTIRGAALDRVTAVSFGGVRTRKISHTSAHRVSVLVPAHPVGPVSVRLVVRGRAGSDTAEYRYVPPPTQLRWSRDRTIDPEVGDLDGLTCPTRRFCVSVEASETAPALLTFAPHGRAHPSPIARGAGAPAVSCTSATQCFALLLRGTVSRWDGRHWSGFRRLASSRAYLDQLSCVAGTQFCLAVGATGVVRVHRPSGWERGAKLPLEAYDSALSCAAAGFCMMVAAGRAFRFDGTGWHAASHGLPSDQYTDPALSCASPTFCLLTGEGETFRWTGSRWHSEWGGFARYGDALACASPQLCILAREDGSASEWRDGHWHKVNSPEGSLLRPAASCPTRYECLTTIPSGVAIYRPSGRSSHYIERSGGDLSDVSCVADWCMAVDGFGNALREAGGKWSRPHRIDRRRALSAVSCADDEFCVAVDGGDTYDPSAAPGVGHAVVYSHGRWHAPAVVDRQHGLTDVACASGRMCIAVDGAGNALRWNGNNWSPPRRVGALLESVACPSPSRCIAVGKHSAVWDAGRWHSIGNPGGFSQLTDVTCTDAQYCVAGGDGGFAVRHRAVWSNGIHHARYLWQVQVACLTRSACFGSQDNQVDVWDYAFDGSRVRFSSEQTYGPKMSCTPHRCVAVELYYAEVGRPVDH